MIERSSASGDNRPAKQPQIDEIAEKLTRGRLIVALDALLKTGSATLAAKRLGLKTSAVSRMLAQLRDLLNDPIFVRSGRGLVPTPFAEEIRPIVAAVIEGIDLTFERGASGGRDLPFDSVWNVKSALQVPNLVVRPAHLLDGEPSVKDIERKLAQVDQTSSSQARLAKALATITTGSGHRRPLGLEEARDAMGIILAGEADPVQIGAFMSILQFRNVTAGELAGFVQATRSYVDRSFAPTRIQADLDWPCYMSPNQQNPPWFFHAARLVSQAGYRVLLHGSSGASDRSGRPEVVAKALEIPVCTSPDDVDDALEKRRIAFVPLAALAPQVFQLLALYKLTGQRSPVRNAVYLLNPANAPASLFGVSESSYKDLHRDTAKLLDRDNITILGNVRDVAQFTPFRATVMHRIVDRQRLDTRVPAMPEPKAEPRARTTTLEYWSGIWTGAVVDERVEKIIVATAAAALMTLACNVDASFPEAFQKAEALWKDRRNKRG